MLAKEGIGLDALQAEPAAEFGALSTSRIVVVEQDGHLADGAEQRKPLVAEAQYTGNADGGVAELRRALDRFSLL
jgi:hypothetical protein